MPLYEYICHACSYRFDKMVARINSDVRCPICQGDVKKLMSTFSIGHSGGGLRQAPNERPPKMCPNCLIEGHRFPPVAESRRFLSCLFI